MRLRLLGLFLCAGLCRPAAAETDVFFHAGPSFVLAQDIKAREFDLPGRQVRFEEQESIPAFGANVGAGLRYFFHENLGVQAEFNYSDVQPTVDFTQIPVGRVKMTQRRSSFFLSVVARKRVGALGLASIYGSAGAGAVLADFTDIPQEWVLGGQAALGADIASAGRWSYFVELRYSWHYDVGIDNQSPGVHLKTSGAPGGNLANWVFGPHYDTQIIGLRLGLRFKLAR